MAVLRLLRVAILPYLAWSHLAAVHPMRPRMPIEMVVPEQAAKQAFRQTGVLAFQDKALLVADHSTAAAKARQRAAVAQLALG